NVNVFFFFLVHFFSSPLLFQNARHYSIRGVHCWRSCADHSGYQVH
ncbi:hypothetical protein PRIPAC_84745, partial [Pristionchus pacificus]